MLPPLLRFMVQSFFPDGIAARIRETFLGMGCEDVGGATGNTAGERGEGGSRGTEQNLVHASALASLPPEGRDRDNAGAIVYQRESHGAAVQVRSCACCCRATKGGRAGRGRTLGFAAMRASELFSRAIGSPSQPGHTALDSVDCPTVWRLLQRAMTARRAVRSTPSGQYWRRGAKGVASAHDGAKRWMSCGSWSWS